MKVVFLKTVPDVARAGDVKEVANGYGRNFLLPKGLATLATPAALKKVDSLRQAEERRQIQLKEEALAFAETLQDFSLTVKAKAGARGRLYGSITNSDIAQQLEAETGYQLDKRQITIEESIRQLGEHEVLLKLTSDVTATLKVIVEGE